MAQNPRYSGHTIGEWTYGSPRVLDWGEGSRLVIGRFCSIAEGVTFLLGGEHRTDWITTYPFSALFERAAGFRGHPMSRGDIVLGNDVWLGFKSLVRSGVRIGNGAVVGAASVVTRDVAPYSIVAGNPARHIRFRFAEADIATLEGLAWWDWPIDKIEAAWPFLLSDDLQNLIDYWKREILKHKG